MTAQITKRDLEQLLVELSPIPELMKSLSEEVAAIRKERTADREALIRTQECVAQVQSALAKLNGSLERIVQQTQDDHVKIGVLDERVATNARLIWGLAGILALVQVLVSLFVK